MSSQPPPPYLSPGSALMFKHDLHGDLCATVLPFPASAFSSYPVILVEISSVAQTYAIRPGTELIVKIFDPRFVRSSRAPWSESTETATTRSHGGQLGFDPKERPDMFEADPEDDPLFYEVLLFKFTTWLQRNEFLAYQHLARLQGSLVPICYGVGVLDLSDSTPCRAIALPVVFLEYVRDGVSLRFDARNLTEDMMRAVMDSGDVLKAHGVIHTDANEERFLLVPASNPMRVMNLDFAEAWTSDAAEDEEDWEGAMREWNVRRHRKVTLNLKLGRDGVSNPTFASA